MLRILPFLIFPLIISGCVQKKEEKEVDNAATRYTDSLLQAREKAEAAAEQANKAIKMREEAARNFE